MQKINRIYSNSTLGIKLEVPSDWLYKEINNTAVTFVTAPNNTNRAVVIKQNFFGTIFVDGLGFILAFVGIINPLLAAAIIHVSSELIFMTNSARLIVDRNGPIKGR